MGFSKYETNTKEVNHALFYHNYEPCWETKLQEHSLKCFKKLPKYKFVSVEGPKHNPVYKISVTIVGSKQFIGAGNSKQQAEQDGASKLLKENNIN